MSNVDLDIKLRPSLFKKAVALIRKIFIQETPYEKIPDCKDVPIPLFGYTLFLLNMRNIRVSFTKNLKNKFYKDRNRKKK